MSKLLHEIEVELTHYQDPYGAHAVKVHIDLEIESDCDYEITDEGLKLIPKFEPVAGTLFTFDKDGMNLREKDLNVAEVLYLVTKHTMLEEIAKDLEISSEITSVDNKGEQDEKK